MIVATISDLFLQTQNQVFLEYPRIKAFQTFPRGVETLASPSKIFPTEIVCRKAKKKPVNSSIVD